MQTLFPPSSLALVALVAFLDPASQELEIGLPAPDLVFSTWIEPGSGAGRTTEGSYRSSDGPGEQAVRKMLEKRGQVQSYHGFPLVVHTLAWEDAPRTNEMLLLMRDLVRANVDRGIAVIGLVDDETGDNPGRELSHPIARANFADSESPYVGAVASRFSQAFVIGPNGALLWHGDPLEDQRGFLAAVQAAYARAAVSPLPGALHPELKKAVTDYLAADLAGAASKARKLARAGDERLRSDAATLTQLVAATQAAWLKEVEQHAASGPDLRYFECVRAIRTSLAKTEAIDELDALEKEAKKQQYWRLRVQDIENWLELRDQRPALFPARVTNAGKAFAKDLQKFRRSTFNTNEATKAAGDLLARFDEG